MDYADAFTREWTAMCERLQADGIEPPSRIGPVNAAGLTAEDAVAEVREMERIHRKRHQP